MHGDTVESPVCAPPCNTKALYSSSYNIFGHLRTKHSVDGQAGLVHRCCGRILRTLRLGRTLHLGIRRGYVLVSLSHCPLPGISKSRHPTSKSVWAIIYRKAFHDSHPVFHGATGSRRLDGKMSIQPKGFAYDIQKAKPPMPKSKDING